MKIKTPCQVNKLDWDTFNFLENLLVFCVMPQRDAPLETGLHFRVSPRETDDSLCLLFETDRRGDSLFRSSEKQPDYMVLYANADQCICTIIELKGGKDLTDGIKQVRNLYSRLKTEINTHLPAKFKSYVKYQALILHAKVSQTPNRLFTEASSKDFTIRPLECFSKAELFDFISQKFTFTQPNNKTENIRKTRKDSSLEKVLMHDAQPKRENDKFCKSKKHIANKSDGIYVNHRLSRKNYSALAVDTSQMSIGIKDAKEDAAKQIKKNLKNIGLAENTHYKFEEIN